MSVVTLTSGFPFGNTLMWERKKNDLHSRMSSLWTRGIGTGLSERTVNLRSLLDCTESTRI
jgi:hypothetical protein